MVVAAVGVGGERPLRVDGAAELPSPDDERVVEHPAGLEILDQCRGRLIGVEALGLEIVGEIAVMVPAAVENLHDADAALDEPAGEDQAVGEGSRLVDVIAIHGERLRRFAAEVDQIGHARLHPEGHLVLRDAGLRLGIVEAVVAAGVELAEGVEHHAPVGAGDAVGIGEIEDRIPGATHRDPGEAGGEEATRPHPREERLRGIDVGLRREHDERREIVVLAPQAVGEPAPQAPLPRHFAAGHHVGASRVVIDGVGEHALDERQVVDDLGRVGEEIGVDPAAAGAALLELELRRGHREALLAAGHRREPLIAADARREILVEVVLELRLVVPEVDLRRPAVGMDVDHAPRLRRVVGQARESGMDSGGGGAARCRIDGRGAGLGKQPAATAALEEGERRGPGADARAAEKRAAAGLKLQVVVSVWVGHGQFLERVSSRLRSMFETSVQAASSSAGIFSGAFDSPNATSRLAASESAA